MDASVLRHLAKMIGNLKYGRLIKVLLRIHLIYIAYGNNHGRPLLHGVSERALGSSRLQFRGAHAIVRGALYQGRGIQAAIGANW